MQLNIEEQIPIMSKVYRDQQIYIPIKLQRILNWKEGDAIQLYPTNKGIFIKKEA